MYLWYTDDYIINSHLLNPQIQDRCISAIIQLIQESLMTSILFFALFNVIPSLFLSFFLSFFLSPSFTFLLFFVYSRVLHYNSCRRAVEQATEPGLASITAYVSHDCTGTDNGFENVTLLFYTSSLSDFIRTLFSSYFNWIVIVLFFLLSVQCRCH